MGPHPHPYDSALVGGDEMGPRYSAQSPAESCPELCCGSGLKEGLGLCFPLPPVTELLVQQSISEALERLEAVRPGCDLSVLILRILAFIYEKQHFLTEANRRIPPGRQLGAGLAGVRHQASSRCSPAAPVECTCVSPVLSTLPGWFGPLGLACLVGEEPIFRGCIGLPDSLSVAALGAQP